MPRVKLFDEDAVLEKATELFWKNGYTATSIQDMVDHLGINRASLYDTFGGKRSLFIKAFAAYRMGNAVKVRKFFAAHPDVRKGLRDFMCLSIRNTLQDADRKGCLVVNTTTELIPGDDEIRAVLEENKNVMQQLFLDYLQTGVDDGQIDADKDLEAIVSLIYTVHNGMQVVAKVESDRNKLNTTIDMALSLLD